MRAARATSIAVAALLLTAAAAESRARAEVQGPPAAALATPLLPKPRGFALETAIALDVGSTALHAAALQWSLFGGVKIGRAIFGLGLRLGGTIADNGTGGANAVTLALAPGLRASVFQSEDGKLELYGQIDFGLGHDFGTLGPGWDATLGLPPGYTFNNSNLQAFGQIGPGLRYWVHPRFAVVWSVLARGDYSTTTSSNQLPPSSTRFESFNFNLDISFGVLAVL